MVGDALTQWRAVRRVGLCAGASRRRRGHVMTLTLRPTGLAAPVDGDHKDFIIMSGEFVLGRIYEECGARPELRWPSCARMAALGASKGQRRSLPTIGRSGWHGQ